MCRFAKSVALVLVTIAGICGVDGQQVSSNADNSEKSWEHEHASLEHQQRYRGWKAEGGLVLSWRALSRDPTANQIDILDRKSRPVVSLNVLRPVPDAAEVSVYDVSARRGQMIAVAAVYRSKYPKMIRPAAALLIFDFNGELLSTFALEPSREISRLEIDDNLNVWTLTSHSDDKDPSQVPMVVEYDSSGKIARELLARSTFPLHARSIREDPSIGGLSSGHDSGVFWFWLPGSTELVTIRTYDGTTAVEKTNLPQVSAVPLRISRDASGNVMAEFRGKASVNGSRQPAYYLWSPSTKVWTRSKPSGCEGHSLIDVDGKEQVYILPDTVNFCTSPVQ
jgi:hypothetical protein